MLGKLFGGGSKKPAEAPKPKVDPQESIKALNAQCETVEKRIRVLEVKNEELKKLALEKKKNKDQRGALMAMKKMKMNEKELAKLDGQQIMLEKQKVMIESANFDVGVINSISAGKDAINEMNKQMNVDDIAEMKDEMEDLQAEMDERAEFFADVAKEGEDELLDELDELEALAVEDEMEIASAGAAVIPNAAPVV